MVEARLEDQASVADLKEGSEHAEGFELGDTKERAKQILWTFLVYQTTMNLHSGLCHLRVFPAIPALLPQNVTEICVRDYAVKMSGAFPEVLGRAEVLHAPMRLNKA